MPAPLRSGSTLVPQLFLQHLMGDVYTTLVNNQLYLGVWGNSNNTNVAEWVPVRWFLIGFGV